MAKRIPAPSSAGRSSRPILIVTHVLDHTRTSTAYRLQTRLRDIAGYVEPPMSDLTSALGTPERPLRVAIVGSGPSGFYAAGQLLNDKERTVEVDLYDRLPTPWGLVRGGVAPDHPKIKSVSRVYEKIAKKPGFRFYGNVEVGRDISHEDLTGWYHAVLYAVGTAGDRKSGIPGEDLPGSWSATEFVGWYNGHPDYRDLEFDLSGKRAIVVGNGNVAVDVA